MENKCILEVSVDEKGVSYWNNRTYDQIVILGQENSIPEELVKIFLASYKDVSNAGHVFSEIISHGVNKLAFISFLQDVLDISGSEAIVLFQSNH